MGVCFLVSDCSLSSDGASGWVFVFLLVVVVYQATVPVDGTVVRVVHKSRSPGRPGCKILYGGPKYCWIISEELVLCHKVVFSVYLV